MQDESSTEERWLPVVGCEGYEVSDQGRVRSLRPPHTRWRESPRMLTISYAKAGRYSVVRLARRLGLVHRLVLEAFVGPCPPGMEACHNDGNPTNNRVGNLRWDTHANNIRDRRQHGTDNAGERHGHSRLSWAAVRTIRLRGGRPAALAAEFGVSAKQIRNILAGSAWRE